MKVADTRTVATPAKKNTPFFNKEGNNDSFFKTKNSNPSIQAKLNIGKPDDHYEKEADSVADKVVQRLSEPASVQKKTIAPVTTISPVIQTKCSHCEQEEKLQKKDKEEDTDLSKNKLQKKPIFESNAEPPPPPDENKNEISALKGSVQKKAIFESNEPIADKHKVQRQVEGAQQKGVPINNSFSNNNHAASASQFGIQAKGTGNEKEEKLQKKEGEDKESPVDKLQKKPIFESNAQPPDDDKNIQKKTGAAHDSNAPTHIESSLNASKGSGSPLPQNTRQQMESSFGSDFSNVRVHNGSSAEQMSKDLNAQAFTHGSDIYFNSGKYDTNSTAGKHLLAHELTHTVQQAGMIQRVPVAKNSAPTSNPGIDPFNPTDENINLKTLILPELKRRNEKINKIPKTLTRPKNYKRDKSFENTATKDNFKKPQAKLWRDSVRAKVSTALLPVFAKAEAAFKVEKESDNDPNAIFYLEWHGKNLLLFGTQKTILDEVVYPSWNKAGEAYAFDADHIQELQLGGKNHPNNLELLGFSANRSSGSKIDKQMDETISKFIAYRKSTDSNAKPDDSSAAKENYNIVFKDVDFDGDTTGTAEKDYWSKEQIEAGDHLKNFEAMSDKSKEGIKGTEKDPVIFTSKAGGKPLHASELQKLPGLGLTVVKKVNGNQYGSLTITVNPSKIKFLDRASLELPIFKKQGVIEGGYIQRGASEKGDGLEQVLSQLKISGLSPVSIDLADILPGKGIVMKGNIHPTLDIIKGIDLDFYIEGNKFGISKTITAGDIKVPPPFKINSASLTFTAGTDGFGVQGDVLFEISKVGKGKISGNAALDGKFGIKGHFEFDKKLFSGGASIDVEYDNEKFWKIHGELGIAKETVKGIKSGKITVDYADNKFTAEGTAIPEIKAVQEITLKIELTKEQFMIEGGIILNKLPGIKSGQGTLKVIKKGEDYSFEGSGKILPDVPGIESEIDFTINNGLFNVDVNVNYDHNRLSGSLHLGITNGGVGDDGKPNNKISDSISFFGGGTLGLMITENLKATAGVNIKRDGNIELTGRIELPKSFQLFPSPLPKIEKDLLPIPAIHIPIFAIPLGVANVGLEATIAPHLKAEAEIGPGLLTNVFAEIDYDTANPDAMTITGGADFEMRAYAMIKVGVDLDLGLSIGVASISGGMGLNAGVTLEAKQPLLHTELKWSPKSGFDFQGLAQVVLSPKLFFSVDAHVKAHVVLAGDYTLLEKKLLNKEFDPGLDFGMKLPFHYQQGKPFNLSFSDIEFVYPKFDSQTLTKLKDSVVAPLKQEFLN